MWYSQVFPSLVPFKKWRREQRNLREGDIVMVKFASEIAQDNFRLGRIVKVQVDKDNLVRTVSVAMRPRDSHEKVLPYRTKDLWISSVSAQRVVVICPVEEQHLIQEAVVPGAHRCPDADQLTFGPDSVSQNPTTSSFPES